jgi:hypothetical protein
MGTYNPDKKLRPKQKKFVQALLKGNSQKESAIIAGYSEKNASTLSSQLLRKASIQEALNKAGLSDLILAKTLKTTITTGLGIKATNSDSIAGLRLAYELKGGLVKDNQDLTQNNTYNIYKNMDNEELEAKLQEIQQDIKDLKTGT